jgi:hypothetical protein
MSNIAPIGAVQVPDRCRGAEQEPGRSRGAEQEPGRSRGAEQEPGRSRRHLDSHSALSPLMPSMNNIVQYRNPSYIVFHLYISTLVKYLFVIFLPHIALVEDFKMFQDCGKEGGTVCPQNGPK